MSYWPRPFIIAGLTEDERRPVGKGRMCRLPVWNSAIVPSTDIRSSETGAQNARGKNFQKFTCSNFCGFVFRGSYFRVLVMGHENCENLDLVKIFCYTVLKLITGVEMCEHWFESLEQFCDCLVQQKAPLLSHSLLYISTPVFLRRVWEWDYLW